MTLRFFAGQLFARIAVALPRDDVLCGRWHRKEN